jgi:heme-degrading monooxygenase HmoA
MTHILVQHEVNDFATWKAVFDAALDWRRQQGEVSTRVFQSADNPNDITLFSEWENLEKARAFISSSELKSKMSAAGVKGAPRVQVLSEVQTLRRSAAD